MVCQLQVDNRAKELACKLERAIKVGDAAIFCEERAPGEQSIHHNDEIQASIIFSRLGTTTSIFLLLLICARSRACSPFRHPRRSHPARSPAHS